MKKGRRLDRFGVCRFSNDPEMMRFYTGFRSYPELIVLYNHVRPVAPNMVSIYNKTSEGIAWANLLYCLLGRC